MFALSAVAVNYWIRFRYLNDYTQLKEPPLVKPDATELHPDVNTGVCVTSWLQHFIIDIFKTRRLHSIIILMISYKLYASLVS